MTASTQRVPTPHRIKLTKRAVDALAPRPARYDVYDRDLPGFLVRVAPSGIKTFGVLYRAGTGRGAPKRRLSIGRYGTLTVEQARQLAREALGGVAQGDDPARERSAAKDAPTVSSLGADYLDDVRDRRKPTTAAEYGRLWAKHVAPALGSRRVADVTPADAGKLHRSLRGTPYLANRVLSLLGAFFAYAERQGERAKHTNPAHDIEPYREASRERFLTPAEITRLGEALTTAERTGLPVPPQLQRKGRGMSRKRRAKVTGRKRGPYNRSSEAPRLQPANPFAVAAIRFLLLTGWREREALTLRWANLDLKRSFATLPDTKTGKSIRVLGAPARLLLSDLPRVEGSPFVFPGRSSDGPLVELSRLWYAVRHAAKLEGVRLHDFRHSFASVSASSGGSLLMIGKLLGHKETATTARYAHLLPDPLKAAADNASTQVDEWLRGRTNEPERQTTRSDSPAAK